MKRKLQVSRRKQAAITITSTAVSKTKIVYIIRVNKKLKYPHRESHIAYIGTSERGVKRMLETAIARTEKLLERHGIRSLDFFVITCTKRQRLRSWESLEQALILLFKRQYGKPPIANVKGKGNVEHWEEDLKRFNEQKMVALLRGFE